MDTILIIGTVDHICDLQYFSAISVEYTLCDTWLIPSSYFNKEYLNTAAPMNQFIFQLIFSSKSSLHVLIYGLFMVIFLGPKAIQSPTIRFFL